jgi:phosphate/sulfate permease
MVGSLLGIVVARKLKIIKYAYVDESQIAEADAFFALSAPAPKDDLQGTKDSEAPLMDGPEGMDDNMKSTVDQAENTKSVIEKQAMRRTAPGEVVSAEQGSANFGLNGKLFLRIVFWWLITVPVAFGIAYGIELIVRPSKP